MPNELKLKFKNFLGLGSSDNGGKPVAPAEAAKPLYREWIPEELPEGFTDMTPTWLYYKIHYEVAAQKVFGLKANTRNEALKLGLTVAVIAILLVFGIVVMSYAGG